MSKLPRRCAALVTTVGFLVAPVAFGQATMEPGKPCAADVKKLCPNVKQGHGAILQCLEGKQDQVSDACKDVVKAKVEEFYGACKDDAAKFCAGVEKGQGKIMKCLYKNVSKLSDTCKTEFAKAKAAAAAAAPAK
jgi:hypothetical protein